MKQVKQLFKIYVHILLVFATVIVAICLSGCQSGTGARQANTPAVHPLTGVVVSVDKAKELITVKHDAIPGKMEAMTMSFTPTDPAALSKVHKGDKISADFSVQANGAVLSNIKVLDNKTS
ncbi:MAG: copper-binding protein [Abditibacteriaceae bacterium]